MNNLIYRALIGIGIGALLLTACTNNVTTSSNNERYYFSLDSFFRAETIRLTQTNPTLEKTVAKDGEKETKSLKISNWENELSSFLSSDINKRANVGLYKVQHLDCDIIYTALQPDLTVQKIIITENQDGQVHAVRIEKITNNMLYNTVEQLVYVTDSLYAIDKKQHINLISDNTYHVEGRFQGK